LSLSNLSPRDHHNINQVHSSNVFAMHLLRDALPDPMLLESTLPPPSSNAPATVSSPQLHMSASTNSMTWTEPRTSIPALPVPGPNGEPWLPAEPLHGYNGPTVFGPDCGWETEFITLVNTNTTSGTPSLDSDAELTHLPPLLLDSPTSDHNASPPPSAIQTLCAYITTVAPSAILPTPPNATTPANTAPASEPPNQDVSATGVSKSKSSRLAGRLRDSVMPGEHARSVELKKWGINEDGKDKTTRKKQLLALHQGASW
jgi:hypothetical protein